MEQEFIVLDWRDMVLWMLKRWWLILLLMALFAGLFGAYETMRDPVVVVEDETDNTTQVAKPTPTPAPTIDDMKAKLTESQIADVDAAYKDYLQVKATIDDLNAQIISMKLDTPEDTAEFEAAMREQANWIAYRDRLASAFTADQKVYYDELRKGEGADKLYLVGEDTEPEVEETEPEVIFEPKQVKRKAVLGGLLGIITSAFILGIFYILDGKVKTVKELKYTYHIDVIEPVEAKQEIKLSALLLENINALVQQKDVGSIFVTGDQNSDVDKKVIDQLSNKIEEKCSELQVKAGDPTVEVEALQQLADMDAVLFIIKLKKTKRTDVVKCMEICKRFERKILGAIVIE